MAGLSKLILPSGSLDASEVASNFDSLKSVVNNLEDHNLEPGALHTRHFSESLVPATGKLNVNLAAGPFKRIYRTEFTQTNITTSYTEMVKLSSSLGGSYPLLYGESTFVFVFAELEVYHTGALANPIGVADMSTYGLYLDFAQSTGGIPNIAATYSNPTVRYVTPGSDVITTSPFPIDAPAEIANVMLFGAALVAPSSTVFDARVMAKSFLFDSASPPAGTGGANGRCRGAISALVVSR